MELTVTYILSQVFVIIMYILLALTYYLKDRKKILIISFLSGISSAIAYILLGAWTGFAMCIFAMIRNIIFFIDEKKNGKRDKITKIDIMILIVLILITVIFTIFTYTDFLSLLSVFATSIYTYSVWQKNTKIYKLLGIPTSIVWISYNVYIMSIFGIILESILLICSTIGYILDTKKEKTKDNS